MELTREQTINVVELHGNTETGCEGCPLGIYSNCQKVMCENVLRYLKEKEPAPSANDTSSEDKNPQSHDTAKLARCQEKIDKIRDDMLEMYETLSEADQRAWDIGEIYAGLTDVKEELK